MTRWPALLAPLASISTGSMYWPWPSLTTAPRRRASATASSVSSTWPSASAAGQAWLRLAFPREAIPPSMTRLQAAASTAPAGRPVVVMDTAPAAVLGALEDPQVGSREEAIVANVGNFHTLAFHLRRGAIAGLFEHHTGKLEPGAVGGSVGPACRRHPVERRGLCRARPRRADRRSVGRPGLMRCGWPSPARAGGCWPVRG